MKLNLKALELSGFNSTLFSKQYSGAFGAGGGFVQPQYVQNITYPGFSGGGGSRTVVVKQDIHPTERMSETDLARIVAEKTQFAVRGA